MASMIHDENGNIRALRPEIPKVRFHTGPAFIEIKIRRASEQ
jgi:hypothetical protein